MQARETVQLTSWLSSHSRAHLAAAAVAAAAVHLIACRENFPTIVRCYAHVCQRIVDGTAWLEPPAPAAAAAAAASKLPDAAAAADASKPPASDASKLPSSSSRPLSRSSSIDLSRNSLSRTCSIDASLAGLSAAAAVAAGRAVCIDEEIFAATTQILTEGFLRIPANQLLEVDYQQTAADVSGIIAITNSFLSQPWKKWLYLAIPGLCEVGGVNNHCTTSSSSSSSSRNEQGGLRLHQSIDSGSDKLLRAMRVL
jgi:hypothetical protein